MSDQEVDWAEAQEALRVVHLKWAIPVLVALDEGPCSWTDLRGHVRRNGLKTGWVLHEKVLNRTLVAMRDEGLIDREEKRGVFPPSVTYRSTAKAAGILVALRSYDDWLNKRKAQ